MAQVVRMIPPPAPGCQGQPMMAVLINDNHPSEGQGAITTAARHHEPTSRREAQVVG